MTDVNDMSADEFDQYIQSHGFATSHKVGDVAMTPMTTEQEEEYAAMEASMALAEGGGPDLCESAGTSEKPWFEREPDHETDHER
jgi:hypothetical protein